MQVFSQLSFEPQPGMQVELLAHLDLTGNLIDDNRARLLSAGLANNHTITHLCLAHNKVRASTAQLPLLHELCRMLGNGDIL